MKPAYQLTVVIAVQYAQENLPAIVRRLDPAENPEVEFLFCTTPADPQTPQQLGQHDNVKVLSSPRGSLIPQLWAAGINAAQAEKVALSSAHLIPAKDWVKQLIATRLTTQPGIGGAILNDAAADARGWAIYLLRYIVFAPPLPHRPVAEIAADNAVYCRSDIMAHADLLENGFWEPSFHARFRQAGKMLALNPELRVRQHNLYSTRQFFAQRLAHGKAFGRARAQQVSSVRRWLLIVLTPVLPLVFLIKIVNAVRQHGRHQSKLVRAFPWLLLFLLAWGLGETHGYLTAGRKSANKRAKKPGRHHEDR